MIGPEDLAFYHTWNGSWLILVNDEPFHSVLDSWESNDFAEIVTKDGKATPFCPSCLIPSWEVEYKVDQLCYQ